jgi:hypothetical protein
LANTPYPPDHALALSRVLRVIDIITARPEIHDDEIVATLVGEGVDPVDARLLIYFVPSALTYPILKQMGVTTPFGFYIVRTAKGRVIHMPLADEHYFTAALEWAAKYFALDPAVRPLKQDAWYAVAGRSAEMASINNYLEQHGEAALRGATQSPLVLGGFTADDIASSRPKKRPWWRFWG